MKSARRWHRKLTNRFRWCVVSIAATAGCAARFGHRAAICFCAVRTAGARGCRNTLATLSLLVQFLPFGPVSFDHVKDRLKFGIQLDQSLERERGRGRKMRMGKYHQREQHRPQFEPHMYYNHRAKHLFSLKNKYLVMFYKPNRLQSQVLQIFGHKVKF